MLLLSKANKNLGKQPNTVDNNNDKGDDNDNDDVNVSMDIEASADNVEEMKDLTVVYFEINDAIGKCLTSVNQAWMSSDVVWDYLTHLCVVNGLKPLQLRTWAWTQ